MVKQELHSIKMHEVIKIHPVSSVLVDGWVTFNL